MPGEGACLYGAGSGREQASVFFRWSMGAGGLRILGGMLLLGQPGFKHVFVEAEVLEYRPVGGARTFCAFWWAGAGLQQPESFALSISGTGSSRAGKKRLSPPFGAWAREGSQGFGSDAPPPPPPGVCPLFDGPAGLQPEEFVLLISD